MATLGFLFISTLLTTLVPPSWAGTWCVARSDAPEQALQSALDYACSAGADCTPIQANGLCFLPNTLLAHASYAFNSFFHRKSMSPAACDFSSAAVLAKTDPSYGSCVYPSSSSTAGGATTNSSTTSTAPMPTTLTPASGDGTAGLNPGTTPSLPPDNAHAASLRPMAAMPLSLFVLACW